MGKVVIEYLRLWGTGQEGSISQSDPNTSLPGDNPGIELVTALEGFRELAQTLRTAIDAAEKRIGEIEDKLFGSAAASAHRTTAEIRSQLRGVGKGSKGSASDSASRANKTG